MISESRRRRRRTRRIRALLTGAAVLVAALLLGAVVQENTLHPRSALWKAAGIALAAIAAGAVLLPSVRGQMRRYREEKRHRERRAEFKGPKGRE